MNCGAEKQLQKKNNNIFLNKEKQNKMKTF